MDVSVLKSPLPIVDGVGPSCKWLPIGPWETVLSFLDERFPGVQTDTWLARMAKGEVVDETGLRLNAKSRYRVGACIFYYRELQSEKVIPFDERILHQDEHILVADKPHFLPVIPAGRFLHETLLVRLRKQGRLEQLVPIHRLDRETAGVVVFSVNPKTRGQYVSLFHQQKVKKVYEAFACASSPNLPMLSFPVTRRSRIVSGEPFFRMKEIPGEANSETYIDLVKQQDGVMLCQLHPVTGRKHQIRLHLSALGIPIVNDKLYPAITVVKNDDFSTPLKLLAKSVCFEDPLTGQERYFESDRTL
jgi:tRNA pseudouridine32 synthase / 23S rRNA pseudouridine746 synthase